MSKRLKTIIILSSVFVAAMVVGVLILSIVGNVSSVEVYDFRVYQSPVMASDSDEVLTSYNYYIAQANSNQTQRFFNDVDSLGGRVFYHFEVADENVATVEDVNGEYLINLRNVGQTRIDIYTQTTTTGGEFYRTFYTSVMVNVYMELADIDVSLSSSSENRIPFIVSQSTSGGRVEVAFASSDPSVARVVAIDGVRYIEYYKAGRAVITAYCAQNSSVRDTVIVNVYNNLPNGLVFVDDNGDKIDQTTIYTDGNYYSIKYNLVYGNGSSNITINGDNVKLASYSTTPILYDPTYPSDGGPYTMPPFDAENHQTGAGVVLDTENNQILVKKTNQNGLYDCLAFIELQTYYVDGAGNEVVTGSYTISVKVLRYAIIGVEIEVSSTPSFDDQHKNILNYQAHLEWEGVEVTSVSSIYFSNDESVRTFYFKVWLVYNNGDREMRSGTQFSVNNINAGDLCGASANGDYYYFKLAGEPVDTSGFFGIIAIEYGDLEYTIRADCINIGADIFYSQNENTGTYTFNYFDERMRSPNEITNNRGEIIAIENPTTYEVN